jgi:glycosyltransferase involved in cell wall biosynthesis
MRIVHINFDDGLTGGATIAARRIFQAGILAGHEGIFVCRTQTAAEGTFRSLRYPQTIIGRTSFYVRRKAAYAALRPFCRQFASVNWVRSGIAAFVNSLEPDIVHLHWVKADTISVEEVAQIRAPIVWSLHDLWPCLGLQAYPSDAPLRGTTALVDAWVRQRKAQVFPKLNIFPVGPSEWCAEEARKSGVFGAAKISAIPYPVDTETFAPRPRSEARARLGMSPDRYVVAFGANNGTRWRIKGFDRLTEAIGRLDDSIRRRTEIVVFGEAGEPRDLHGARLAFAGRISEPESLTWLYSAADVFALPSRQETFGQTKSEALACGTPVVAFDQTACGEGIQHGVTGWVARPDDIQHFAEGLTWAHRLATDTGRQQAVQTAARNSAVDAYSMAAVSRQWSDCYDMVGNAGSRSR